MAVFTEAELKSTKQVDVFAMLEGANYLTEDEARIQPQLIPVKENSRLKGFVVRFEDVENLAESVNCDYITAMQSISETNNLDKPLVVAVDECDLIEDPSLLQELNNVVISPISENDIVYQYCENILEEYMETEDESLLEALTDRERQLALDHINVGLIKHRAKNKFRANYLTSGDNIAKRYNMDKHDTRTNAAAQRYFDYIKNKNEKDPNGKFITQLQKKLHTPDSTRDYYTMQKDQIEKIKQNANQGFGVFGDINRINAEIKAKELNNELDNIIHDNEYENLKNKLKKKERYSWTKNGINAPKVDPPNYKKLLLSTDKEVKEKTDQYMKDYKELGPNGVKQKLDKEENEVNERLKKLGVDIQLDSNKLYNKYATRPKSVIVRKIAALRNLYHKWMIKAKTSKDTGFVAKIKRMCAKVLGVIDKLLKIVNNKLKGKAQKVN